MNLAANTFDKRLCSSCTTANETLPWLFFRYRVQHELDSIELSNSARYNVNTIGDKENESSLDDCWHLFPNWRNILLLFFLRTSAHCSLQHVHDMISFVFHSVNCCCRSSLFSHAVTSTLCFYSVWCFQRVDSFEFWQRLLLGHPPLEEMGANYRPLVIEEFTKVGRVSGSPLPQTWNERFRISRILRDPVTRDTVNWGCCCSCQTRSLLKQTFIANITDGGKKERNEKIGPITVAHVIKDVCCFAGILGLEAINRGRRSPRSLFPPCWSLIADWSRRRNALFLRITRPKQSSFLRDSS